MQQCVGLCITITENTDGTFTFTPKAGALGRDQFKVIYRSDAGNEVGTRVQVSDLFDYYALMCETENQ
jgi:hypothetical protein